MKLMFIFFTLILSCSNIAQEHKLVIKKITNNDITIKWYYYSYITDGSPDIIEITKNNITDTILEAIWEITNVTLTNDTITIRLYQPQPGLMKTKNIRKEIFGYKIILDSSGTLEEKELLPKPVKEE